MVRAKICGITNRSDAFAAVDLGASALGFNFYQKSPRVVSPGSAWGIVRRLPPLIATFGVFVNWEPDAVVALTRSLRLSGAQLHGDETSAAVRNVAADVTVIKALSLGKGIGMAALARYDAAAALLLDAPHSGEYGGTGKVSNWQLAAKAARKYCVVLAGGLTPGNIYDAILAVRPFAVDVASGVESRPGKKDRGKLRAFLEEVARANQYLATRA